MRINTNVSSLQAQRQLSTTTRALQRAMERLASGRRINRAGDDAAGLAISEGLKSQVRGFGQVARNINDAMGLLLTVDGVLGSQIEITQRMRELAVQSSTGTLSNTDRANLNTEFQTLLEEFERISSQANFNGVNLLDGSLSEMSIQAGNSKGETITFGIEDSRSAAIFTDIQGSGEFSQWTNHSSVSVWTEAGDLNDDGFVDYVQRVGTRIFSMINNGDGTFSRAQTIPFTGTQVGNESTAMGDFNGDGHIDFIAGTTSGTQSTVYLGDGTGHFSVGELIADDIREADTGDINGDGTDDLIYVSFTTGTVRVRLGQQGGSFAAAQDIYPNGGMDVNVLINSGMGFEVLNVADYNGDGVDDFAFQNNSIVDIVTQDASGNFTMEFFGIDDVNGSMISGDFNNDGLADIAFSGVLSESTRVYFNQGRGQEFLSGNIFDTESVDLASAKDINGDGHIDLTTESGYIYFGNGHGDFEKTSGAPTGELSVADFNDDGFLDLLSGSTSNVYLQGSVEVSAAQPFRITSATEAQRMLEIMSNAIENLVSRRASIGALMSRLESAENVSLLTRENLSAAHSQIMDADIAYETAELTKQQFLQQAAISVLSQANINLQIVLKLLKP